MLPLLYYFQNVNYRLRVVQVKKLYTMDFEMINASCALVKLCRYARVRSTTTFLPGGMPYHYFYGGKKLRDLCIWSVDAACRENVLVCINQARESITM